MCFETWRIPEYVTYLDISTTIIIAKKFSRSTIKEKLKDTHKMQKILFLVVASNLDVLPFSFYHQKTMKWNDRMRLR